MTNNRYTLHTEPGCSKADVTTQSGTTYETDCSTVQGCLVAENKPDSYGPDFAAAGGGVFALQMDSTGINMWFFSVCPTSACSTYIHTTLAAPSPRRYPASNHLLSNGHEHLGYPNSRVSQLFVFHANILPPSAISTADYALRFMVRSVKIINMSYSNSCLAFPKIGPEHPQFTSRLALAPAYAVSFMSENQFFKCPVIRWPISLEAVATTLMPTGKSDTSVPTSPLKLHLSVPRLNLGHLIFPRAH